jgi:hypothetical protein
MPNLYDVVHEMHDTVFEYRVVAAAVQRYQAEVLAANVPLPEGTQPHHLASAVDELEGTYLIRLWAVFETAWKSYWRHATNRRDGRIRAFDLIQWAQGVQEGRQVDASITPLVHQVREYRNFLVHERDNAATPVPISEARTRLSTHLAKLPDQWPSVGDDE